MRLLHAGSRPCACSCAASLPPLRTRQAGGPRRRLRHRNGRYCRRCRCCRRGRCRHRRGRRRCQTNTRRLVRWHAVQAAAAGAERLDTRLQHTRQTAQRQHQRLVYDCSHHEQCRSSCGAGKLLASGRVNPAVDVEAKGGELFSCNAPDAGSAGARGRSTPSSRNIHCSVEPSSLPSMHTSTMPAGSSTARRRAAVGGAGVNNPPTEVTRTEPRRRSNNTTPQHRRDWRACAPNSLVNTRYTTPLRLHRKSVGMTGCEKG